MIKLVAHRGGAALRPENTLPAVRHALANGIDGIEVDVHLCADNKVVVHHDYKLNPMIARLGSKWIEAEHAPYIKDLTYDQLLDYDVGRLRPESSLAAKHPNQTPVDGARIPLLEDVMALIADHKNTFLQIELKRDAFKPDQSRDIDASADELAKVIVGSSLLPRLWAISFDWGLLLEVKSRVPGISTGFLTDTKYSVSDERGSPWAGGFDPADFGGSYAAAIQAAGGKAWGPNFQDVTAELVRDACERGLDVAVWTVNRVEDLHRMSAFGVTMAASDDPWTLKLS